MKIAQELKNFDNLLITKEEENDESSKTKESNETNKTQKINKLNDLSKIKKELNEIETIDIKRIEKIMSEIKIKIDIMNIYNTEMNKNIEKMNENANKYLLPEKNDIDLGSKIVEENGYIIDSQIISKNKEYNLINNKLKEIYKSEISYELLYRASEHGPFGKIFKKKCSQKKKTLIFVETKKNKKFGGFTEAIWNDSNSNYKDEKTFCFSFDENKIYTIKKNANSISCQSDYGPIFCNMFDITDNFVCDGGYAKNLKIEAHNYNGVTKDYELTGEEFFGIKELEVFKVNLN